MAPIAAAVEITVLSSMLLAVLVGALCGAVLWQRSLLMSALSAVTIFVLAMVADSGFFWLRLAATFGAGPLAQALLLSRFTARELAARLKLRALWSGVLGFIVSLVIGALCLRLPERMDFWMPSWIAAGVVACLLAWSIARRKAISL